MAASDQTLVCVKQVKQEVADEWDVSMPLPGDIIEGFSEHDVDDADESFVSVKTSSEFSCQLGKINQRVESIWIRVRRGDGLLKLQTCIVQQKVSVLRRKYTIQATTDHRHIADLADLTLKQCIELQGRYSLLSLLFTKFSLVLIVFLFSTFFFLYDSTLRFTTLT